LGILVNLKSAVRLTVEDAERGDCEGAWAEPGSRFTLHFERFAVAVIAVCRSLTQAADLLGLHWHSVQRNIDQTVTRGHARRTTEGIRRVGLDETSFLRGQNHVALIFDLSLLISLLPGCVLAWTP
jgi:transposase